MRRERQSKVESHSVDRTQGAFDFAPEATPTLKPAAAAARRSASSSSPAPRAKRAERVQVPEQPAEVKPAAKQRKASPAAENDTGRQKAPMTGGRKSKPVVSTSEPPVPAATVVAPVAESPAKRQPQRKKQPATVPLVDTHPITAIEPGASLAAGDSVTTAPHKEKRVAGPRERQAKAQTPVVPAPQTPQPDTQPLPRTEAKPRGSKPKDVAAKKDLMPSNSTKVSASQAANIPAPSSDSSTAVTAQAQPVPTAAPAAPSTWRYVGKREEADQLYRRRFGTEDVPEPMMIAGTWAYALPAMRRPLA